MISEKHAYELLDRIGHSEGFVHSESNRNLLKYLIDKSLSDEIPRELDIAIDFFNKDADYHTSEDSLVRSHIWSLRKKLENYYLKEGRGESIKLLIPKGRYEVLFLENDPGDQSQNLKSGNKTLFRASMGILLIGISLIIYSQFRQRTPTAGFYKEMSNDEIWSDFSQSPLPTQFVMGDYFVYIEERSDRSGWRRIRSGSVNSLDDLRQYYDKNPEFESDFLGLTHTYVNPSVPHDAMVLFPRFILSGVQVRYNNSSWMTEDDFQSSNLIYFGPLKTLRMFKPYLEQSSFDCSFYPHQILVKNKNDTTSLKTLDIDFDDGFNYRKDYTLVIKVPGPNQNIIMLVSNFSPYGLHRVVTDLESGEFVEQVRKKYLSESDEFPNFFESIIQIDIVGDVMNSTIIDFRPIAAD